jgi:Transglutaminase-like enzymes, putative cysteine proteases
MVSLIFCSLSAIDAVSDSTAPTIKSTDPTNNAVNVSANKTIKVTFSESIKKGTGWIDLMSSSGKNISVTTSVSGNVLTVKPKSNLSTGTRYTLLVHSGSVKDLSGNRYLYAGCTDFTTDKAPTITSIDPSNQATSVAVNKTIKVTFSESIKKGTVWIDLLSSAGKNISVTTSVSGKVLTITPKSNLSAGTKYTLLVHSGSVTDLSGNRYLYAGSTTFTTASAASVAASSTSLQQYLAATANCQVTNSAIKAKAAAITSGKTTTSAKATAIYNWVRDNLGYSFYYNTKYGAVGTLSKMTGNCCDTAHLVVALERAAGIPARYEHVYAKFSSGSWYGHVIAQVYVNGKWYNADATSYSNSFGVIKNWNTATATVYGTYASLPF